MMFFAEWNTILYLCSPILTDMDKLVAAGLYINDLPMHDFSRDLVLSGSNKKNLLSPSSLDLLFEFRRYN